MNFAGHDVSLDLSLTAWLERVLLFLGVGDGEGDILIGPSSQVVKLLARARAGAAIVDWIAERLEIIREGAPLVQPASASHAEPLLVLVERARSLTPDRPVRHISGRGEVPGVWCVPGPHHHLVVAETTALLGWDLWTAGYIGAQGEVADSDLIATWTSARAASNLRHGSLLRAALATGTLNQLCHWFLETRRHERMAGVFAGIDERKDWRQLLMKDLAHAAREDAPHLATLGIGEDWYLEARRVAMQIRLECSGATLDNASI